MFSKLHRHALGDMLARSAARVPHKTALIWQGQHETYAALDEAVNRCANALSARGINKGERVAILSHNHRAFVVINFALARLGAIMVPINFMLNAAEVAFILEHSGAIGIVAENALLETADAAIAKLPTASAINLRGCIC